MLKGHWLDSDWQRTQHSIDLDNSLRVMSSNHWVTNAVAELENVWPWLQIPRQWRISLTILPIQSDCCQGLHNPIFQTCVLFHSVRPLFSHENFTNNRNFPEFPTLHRDKRHLECRLLLPVIVCCSNIAFFCDYFIFRFTFEPERPK